MDASEPIDSQPDTDASKDSAAEQSATFDAGEKPALNDAEAFLDAVKKLPEGTELLLDAEKISEMTTTFLIAVVGATKTLTEAGGKVAIQRPSPAFLDAFSDLGLFQEMMKMEFRQ